MTLAGWCDAGGIGRVCTVAERMALYSKPVIWAQIRLVPAACLTRKGSTHLILLFLGIVTHWLWSHGSEVKWCSHLCSTTSKGFCLVLLWQKIPLDDSINISCPSQDLAHCLCYKNYLLGCISPDAGLHIFTNRKLLLKCVRAFVSV